MNADSNGATAPCNTQAHSDERDTGPRTGDRVSRKTGRGKLTKGGPMTGPPQPLSVRLVLFMSSYSPLFTILAVRFEEWKLRLAMGIIAAVGALLLLVLLLSARRAEPKKHTVSTVDDRGNDVAAYVATYLLPLIVLTVPSIPDLIGYGIFLLVSAVVFVQSRMVAISPLVYLFNRRILLVHTDSGGSFFLINKRAIFHNEPIWTRQILPGFAMRSRDHSRKVGGWG